VNFLMMLLFALAVSMDGFVVGLSYGVKDIILPLKSTLIVSAISGLIVCLSMLAGIFSTTFISIFYVNIIATVLLVVMGLWLISTAWREQHRPKAIAEETLLFRLHLPLLPYVIQVIKAPEKAAGDNEEVDNKEAWVLGLALAFDSMGGGFAVAMAGLSVLQTSVMVMLACFLLIEAAMLLGKKFRLLLFPEGRISPKIENSLSYLPGIIILLLALWKIITC